VGLNLLFSAVNTIRPVAEAIAVGSRDNVASGVSSSWSALQNKANNTDAWLLAAIAPLVANALLCSGVANQATSTDAITVGASPMSPVVLYSSVVGGSANQAASTDAIAVGARSTSPVALALCSAVQAIERSHPRLLLVARGLFSVPHSSVFGGQQQDLPTMVDKRW
jgi:hypothetical protein